MQMTGLFRRTRVDLARRWRAVLAWQLLVQLLGFAAITPLVGWLADRLVARSGSAAVSNFDIAGFVLSVPGLAFVLLVAGVTTCFYIALLAGHAWISGHAIAGRPVTVRDTIGAVTGRLRVLAGCSCGSCCSRCRSSRSSPSSGSARSPGATSTITWQNSRRSGAARCWPPGSPVRASRSC
jgi:hypothetical protein